MRVQHNIAAMNSYRNYSNNTKTINKNLEKLSSGYKINRAGDDAAGLAISEKMRAQITGLEGAQKNAKDGISLVQTAEGALTEVHSMLNRMYSLAEQSANGTYEGLDRDQLQKEVGKLREEIDRIADSANFNGIKLLNGDMATEGATVGAVGTATKTTAQAEVDTITETYSSAAADGDRVSAEVTMLDANGTKQTLHYEFTINSKKEFVKADGTSTTKKTLMEAIAAVSSENKDALSTTFTANKDVFTAKETGSNKGQLLNVRLQVNGENKVDPTIARTKEGKDVYQQYDAAADGTLAKIAAYDGTNGKAGDAVFSVNGYRFAFATAGNTGAFDSDVHVVTSAAKKPVTGEVKDMVATINRVVGRNVANVDATKNTAINFLSNTGSGLKLQIGDTAESFNQLDVSISDMHAGALGISQINIANQGAAQDAMDAIKSAINKVSENRGTLGATQNRLEHTINNLSVMQENIQDAESTIRDTDVAAEMMKYTKNSILVQSAQAMLAQANQQPQGVLQLLQ
jgi:flagellin